MSKPTKNLSKTSGNKITKNNSNSSGLSNNLETFNQTLPFWDFFVKGLNYLFGATEKNITRQHREEVREQKKGRSKRMIMNNAEKKFSAIKTSSKSTEKKDEDKLTKEQILEIALKPQPHPKARELQKMPEKKSEKIKNETLQYYEDSSSKIASSESGSLVLAGARVLQSGDDILEIWTERRKVAEGINGPSDRRVFMNNRIVGQDNINGSAGEKFALAEFTNFYHQGRDPEIARFSNGNYICTWTQSDESLKIKSFVQIYNGSTHKPLGDVIELGDSVFSPEVAVLDDDSFVIGYDSDSGVKLQRFNSSGVAIGDEFDLKLNPDSGVRSENVVLVPRDGEGFIAAYQLRNIQSNVITSQIKKYEKNDIVGKEIASADSDIATIAIHNDGELIIAYPEAGAINVLKHNLYTDNFAHDSASYVASEAAVIDLIAVKSMTNGDFVVAFVIDHNRIMAQRFESKKINSMTVKIGDSFEITSSNGDNPITSLDLIANDDGGFSAVFSKGYNYGSEISKQRINRNNEKVTPDGQKPEWKKSKEDKMKIYAPVSVGVAGFIIASIVYGYLKKQEREQKRIRGDGEEEKELHDQTENRDVQMQELGRYFESENDNDLEALKKETEEALKKLVFQDSNLEHLKELVMSYLFSDQETFMENVENISNNKVTFHIPKEEEELLNRSSFGATPLNSISLGLEKFAGPRDV